MNYPEKIELILTYKHDPDDIEIFTEKVDAEKVGQYYRLIHVPAFAPNIAYGDLVKVAYEDGQFHFEELIEESGFSVVHVVIWNLESKDQIVSNLIKFGCGVNAHVAENYLVISIPPQLVYNPICTFLLTENENRVIDFKECLSKVHRDNL